MTSMSTVPKFYKSVIDDVLAEMRESLLEEQWDEQMIQEFLHTWTNKIEESKALDNVLNQESAASNAAGAATSSSSTNLTSTISTSSNSSSLNNHKETNSGGGKSSSKNSSKQNTTSVITSNPNHVKNGSNNHTNSSRSNKNNINNGSIKAELQEKEELRLSQQLPQQQATVTTTIVSQQQPQPMINTNPTTIIQQAAQQQQQQPQLNLSNPNVIQQHHQITPAAAFVNRTSAIVTNQSAGQAAAVPIGTQQNLLQDLGHKLVFLQQPIMFNPNLIPGTIIHQNGQHTLMPGFGSAIQYASANVRGATGMPTTIQQMRPIMNTNLLHQTPATVMAAGSVQPTVVQQASAPTSGVGGTSAGGRLAQLDGPHDNDDSSEDEEDDDYRENDDENDDDDNDINDDEIEPIHEDEEPLNSGDDVSDEDPSELFETDNVVVCQYDKITRSRNKWKFHFKDGIMNLQGKDYVFQKATGDAEW